MPLPPLIYIWKVHTLGKHKQSWYSEMSFSIEQVRGVKHNLRYTISILLRYKQLGSIECLILVHVILHLCLHSLSNALYSLLWTESRDTINPPRLDELIYYCLALIAFLYYISLSSD